jgi:hypothetical protein
MLVKKVPLRDGVAFAAVVTLSWHSRRLRAAIGLIEFGPAQVTIALAVEEVQRARRSKCS